jgi:hypothetical protein
MVGGVVAGPLGAVGGAISAAVGAVASVRVFFGSIPSNLYSSFSSVRLPCQQP